MRGEGRGVARFGLADLHEQRRTQPLHQLRGDDVGGFIGAADPLPQMVEIELVSHDDLVRAEDGFAIAMRSPMPGTAP